MNREHHINVDPKQLKLLKEILQRHVPDKTVWAYGSRVHWKAQETSDLDLVAFGCSSGQIFDLKEELAESNLLFSVDVMDWETVSDSFKNNIKKKYVVVQEKAVVPNGWREVKLGDVIEINPTEYIAKNTPAKKVNMDVLMPFNRKIPKCVTGEYKGGSKFKNGDTLLARITPCLENGKTAFVDFLESGEVGFGSTEFIVMREKSGVTNKDFVYYLATSKNFREIAIKSMTGTSGRQRVETKKISGYKFHLPPLPEQKAIAEVLSSLDDKIDLLHRQNKTLEDMAQTLFRKWFVENAAGRGEKIILGDFVKCTTGHSYRSNELIPSNSALVTLKNFARDGSFRMDGYKEFLGKYKDDQIVKQGDLVVAHTDITQDADIIGSPVLVIQPEQYKTLVVSMDLMKVESAERWLGKEFLLYLFRSRHFKGHCLGYSNGTTVLHMNRKTIPTYSFTIPSKEKVIEFTNIVKPEISKTFGNIAKIRNLQKLRDILLPVLVSGTARAKGFH